MRHQYLARRALEKVNGISGARPVQLYKVLIPVWCVEVRLSVRKPEQYGILDRFIERGIAEAQLDSPDALINFFAVPPSLIYRTIPFLEKIGHLNRDPNGRLRLTALGADSVRDAKRYIMSEEQRKLFFDGYTTSPFPTEYYVGSTGAFLREEECFNKEISCSYKPLYSETIYKHSALEKLMTRTDKADFNIPDGYMSYRALEAQRMWLPTCIIRNDGHPSFYAFSAVSWDHDEHLERLVPHFSLSLEIEETATQERVWQQWLESRGFSNIKLTYLPNGVPRITLPSSAFGVAEKAKFGISKLGSFENSRGLFMQLWCDDVRLRHYAALSQAGNKACRARSLDEIITTLHDIALQFEVPTPTLDDLQEINSKAKKRIESLRSMEVSTL